MSARPLVRDRYSFGNLEEVLPLPHLIDIQRKSFKWFRRDGIADTFSDLSPITDSVSYTHLTLPTKRIV